MFKDPAKIVEVFASKNEVAVQQSVSLRCKAEGNPSPSYRWTPCEQPQSVCHNSVLNISEVLNDAVYICTVANSLNSDAGNFSVCKCSFVITCRLIILCLHSNVSIPYFQQLIKLLFCKNLSIMYFCFMSFDTLLSLIWLRWSYFFRLQVQS